MIFIFTLLAVWMGSQWDGKGMAFWGCLVIIIGFIFPFIGLALVIGMLFSRHGFT